MTADGLCLRLMEMSLYGGCAILAAMLLSEGLWKLRTPRGLILALWAVVAVRLLCPLTLPASPVWAPVQGFVQRMARVGASYAGDVRVAVHVPGSQDDFARAVDAGVAPVKTDMGFDAAFYYEEEDGAIMPARTWRQSVAPKLALAWCCGAMGMLLYGAVAQALLRRKLRFAVREGEVYISDRIASPCVVGLCRPRIYLTFALTQRQRQYVQWHERAHIRHGDVLYKALAYAVLCVHWFNPLAWAAFQYLMTLLEKMCDERVLQEAGEQARQDYSEALLALSVKRRFATTQSMHFGENDVKVRVRAILRGKRPVKWMAWVAAPLCLVAGLCLLGSAAEIPSMPLGATYEVQHALYHTAVDTAHAAPQFRITAGYQLHARRQGETDWTRLGGLMRVLLSQDDLAQMADAPLSRWDEANGVQTAYRVNAQGQSYFILQMQSGEVLLAIAQARDGQMRMESLLHLRAMKDEPDDAYLCQSLQEVMDGAPVRLFDRRMLPDGVVLVGFAVEEQTPTPDLGCALLTKANGKYELHTWRRAHGGAPQGRKTHFGTLISPDGRQIGVVLSNDPNLRSIRVVTDGVERIQQVAPQPDAPLAPRMTVWEGEPPPQDAEIYFYDVDGRAL